MAIDESTRFAAYRKSELKKVFSAFDLDHRGFVDFNEFHALGKAKPKPKPKLEPKP